MVLWIVENERKRRIVIESDADDWHDWLLTLPTLSSLELIFLASNFHLIDPYFDFAVAIWPVTGQGFQNTKWPAVLSFQ